MKVRPVKTRLQTGHVSLRITAYRPYSRYIIYTKLRCVKPKLVGLIPQEFDAHFPKIARVQKNKIQLDCSRWYTIANTRFFPFDIDPMVMVTPNVVEYPQHHVMIEWSTYAPVKFEVATSNRLGDAFTRQFDLWPWYWPCRGPSTLCDLWTCKNLSCNVLQFRNKIHYLTSDLDFWVKASKIMPSTLFIMWPIQD